MNEDEVECTFADHLVCDVYVTAFGVTRFRRVHRG